MADNTRNVAMAVAEALSLRGTRRVWGVPGGGAALDLIAALPAAGLSFILARQESAAAIMALTDAELTGAPGAVLTTKGPGVSAALNGVACATLERAPLALLSDGFADEDADWVSHQAFDQRAATAPLAKGHGRADDAAPEAEIGALLDLAMEAPRGAVHLDLADRIARRPAGAALPPAPPAPLAPDHGDAAALLAQSRRPVILAGLEAATAPAAAALRALAEALGAPVLVTYKAKGVLADAHPLFGGVFTGGAAEARLVGQADLIIQAGLDPVELIPQRWRYAAPVLDLAVRPHPRRYAAPAAARHGGIADSLAALLPAARRGAWTPAEIAALRAATLAALDWQVPVARGVSPPDIVRMAQAAALHAGQQPRATVDAGAHMFSATTFWACEAPRDLLISNGLASMGFALPAGIAAALHDPARGAIAFTGDGGLLMCLGELATAVEQRANLVVVVFNDAALSLIDIKQQARHLPPSGARYAVPVDFAAVARGFGLRGFAADDPASYLAALRQAFAEAGPALIDVRVDPAGYPAQIQALRG
jgi:acetolactate synthase-1/2/3 large subunit